MRWAILLLVTILWTAGCLAFDYFVLARPLIATVNARSFVAVPSTILRSSAEPVRDSYRAQVEYQYSVNGQSLKSDRAFLNERVANELSTAQRDVARFPVGANVTAYYNPLQPTTAVLDRGLPPMVGWLALFLTPFNMGAVLLWIASARRVLDSNGTSYIGHFRVREDMSARMAELYWWTTSFVCGICVCLASFVAVFLTGITLVAPLVPLWVVPVVWIAGLVAGVIFDVRWRRVRGERGGWLIADWKNRTLRIPSNRPWKPPLTVPFDSVRSVRSEELIHPVFSEGATRSPQVRIDLIGGEPVRTIGPFMQLKEAEAFAAWLRTAIGHVQNQVTSEGNDPRIVE